MIKVAVYGYGNVGRYVVDSLLNLDSVDIAYVVTRTPRSDLSINFITDINVPLIDKSIDVILECISDIDVAEYVAKKSFANNKTLISCNKRLWSQRWMRFGSSDGVALLNSLACNSEGTTAYPEIDITLTNLRELDQNDLYSFRGCDGRCAAYVMVHDLITQIL